MQQQYHKHRESVGYWVNLVRSCIIDTAVIYTKLVVPGASDFSMACVLFRIGILEIPELGRPNFGIIRVEMK